MPQATLPPHLASAPGRYTTRLLPPEEWDRLKALQLPGPLPDPASSLLLVAETSTGEIVAIWAAITVVHVHGAWVHPDHRNGPAAARMVTAMKDVLREYGIWTSFTLIETPELAVIAQKAGFARWPYGDLWYLHLEPEPPPEKED